MKLSEHKTVSAQRLVDLSTSVGTKEECSLVREFLLFLHYDQGRARTHVRMIMQWFMEQRALQCNVLSGAVRHPSPKHIRDTLLMKIWKPVPRQQNNFDWRGLLRAYLTRTSYFIQTTVLPSVIIWLRAPMTRILWKSRFSTPTRPKSSFCSIVCESINLDVESSSRLNIRRKLL